MIYPVVVNSRIVGSLKAGTFLRTEVQPGQVQVTSFTTTAQSVVPLTIRAGEIMFVSTAYHASVGTAALGIAGCVSLAESDEATAKADIQLLQLTVSQ
ncbi:MAG: hypothetical protein NWF07_16010 [Candidatus Bathyarchaeota archaeon]|nr:hypothetical protein [Candidatus Bathyarchaeota archaeon]